jgi:hypothetical protein
MKYLAPTYNPYKQPNNPAKMKNYCIIFLLLFALKNVDAQNWKPLTNGEKYNYAQGSIFATIWADSVKYINSDSVFYLNRLLKKVKSGDPKIGSVGYLQNQSQFFLSKIIYSPSSDVLMEENDSVKFLLKPRAKLNDIWLFDSLKHDTAKVINVLTIPVFGKMDSVKIITLTSNDSIVLSKNYGILKFPNSDSVHQHINLVGIEGRNVGMSVPKFKDIFDLKVDDIFYYRHNSDTYRTHKLTDKKIRIIAKKINGDTITYTVNYKSRSIAHNDIGNWTFTTYSNVADSIMIYTDYNKILFDGYSGMILKEGYDYQGGYYKPINNSYNNLFSVYTKTPPFNPYIKSSTTDTILEYFHLPQASTFHSVEYGSSLGVIDDSFFEMYSVPSYRAEKETLLGYIRNGKTTGTTIDDSIFTSVPSFEDELSFKIYPNPVKNNFVIENESNMKQGNMQIFDINGRELLQQKITTIKTEIDISSLAKGIYFVKLITNEAVGVRKIIKE